MSPRPYWKGYLKLALVSCPIALHAVCSSTERVSFRQINRKTGNRLRQQLIDEETREVVEAHEKARGYEIGKGQYLLIEDDELEAIEIASTHTIDIDSFVPRAEIDQRFFDAPYYITPDDPVGQDAFAVIREAMRSKALVALGRVVLSKRERVMALEPYDRGLIGTTLRYPYEVRNATDYFDEIPDLTPAPELLRLAAHILDSKIASFAPAGFRDRYEEALLAHLRAKQAGLPPPRCSLSSPAESSWWDLSRRGAKRHVNMPIGDESLAGIECLEAHESAEMASIYRISQLSIDRLVAHSAILLRGI